MFTPGRTPGQIDRRALGQRMLSQLIPQLQSFRFQAGKPSMGGPVGSAASAASNLGSPLSAGLAGAGAPGPSMGGGSPLRLRCRASRPGLRLRFPPLRPPAPPRPLPLPLRARRPRPRLRRLARLVLTPAGLHQPPSRLGPREELRRERYERLPSLSRRDQRTRWGGCAGRWWIAWCRGCCRSRRFIPMTAPHLELSIALSDNERTRPLLEGRVAPQGIKLVPTIVHPSEMFWRQLTSPNSTSPRCRCRR